MKSTLLASLACLVLVSIQVTIEAARIKIHLQKESVEKYRAHVFKRQADGSSCDDRMEIERNNLTLPGKLDQLNQRVTFYRSAIATANLDAFQDLQVPLVGSNDITVREVVEVLRNTSCLPFFFGGALRDQFLNKQPDDADVEVDCSIEMFHNVCIEAWGESNCFLSSGPIPFGHVGNSDANPTLQDVDVASTDFFSYSPISFLEYTVNSMAYDLNGNDVIIDVAGTGVRDACNKHIRIPSDDDSIASWNQWLTDTSATAVYRFWKLREKGLTAFNNATLEYITNQARILMNADPNSFPKFYCDNVYDSDYNSAGRMCTATAMDCEENRGRAMTYDTALAADFGSYWDTEIQPNQLPTCAGALSMGYSLKLLSGLMLIVLLAYF